MDHLHAQPSHPRRIAARGAEFVGGVRYEDSYRLCYVRGPEEQIG